MSLKKDQFKLILWCDVAVRLGKEDYQMLLHFWHVVVQCVRRKTKEKSKEKNLD